MPIPPEPVLQAASRWLQLLGTSGLQRTRALLGSAREYSNITPTQYSEALGWLQMCGLVDKNGVLREGAQEPMSLFEASMTHGGTSWFDDSDFLVQSPEELPEDALRAAKAFGLAPAAAFVGLRHAWGKVDTAQRKLIGDAGEELLLALLDRWCAASVTHVAAQSDGWGYDIDVRNDDFVCHVEVKATTRPNRQVIHLSRNEYETMIHDSSWHLVVLCLNHDLTLRSLYSVNQEWLRIEAPSDVSVGSVWESARFEVPLRQRTSGMPILSAVVPDSRSPLLTGFQ